MAEIIECSNVREARAWLGRGWLDYGCKRTAFCGSLQMQSGTGMITAKKTGPALRGAGTSKQNEKPTFIFGPARG
jgi:hypothetical protein